MQKNMYLHSCHRTAHLFAAHPITRKRMCKKEPDPKKERHKDNCSFPKVQRFIVSCAASFVLICSCFFDFVISFGTTGLLRPITAPHWLISIPILTKG